MSVEHRNPLLQQYQATAKVQTASTRLTGNDAGKAFTNTGASGAVTLILPKATTNRTFTFLGNAASNLVVQPLSTDNIRGSSVGVATNLASGALLALQCVTPGTWEITNGSGGGGGSLSVTDGTTTVSSVTSVHFTSGATVTSGGVGVADVAVAGGGSNPFNITPDTHGSGVPAFVANDYFEEAALDTGGTRFTGALPWTQVNFSPSGASNTPATAVLVEGALQFKSALGPGGGSSGRAVSMITQPLPGGSAWRYRAKIGMYTTGSSNLGGLVTYESASGKLVGWGPLVNPTNLYFAFAGAFTSTAVFFQDIGNTIVGSDLSLEPHVPAVFEIQPRWYEMERSAGNLILRLSTSGLDGTFWPYLTAPISSYFTTAPDSIGLYVDAVGSSVPLTLLTVDTFLREA